MSGELAMEETEEERKRREWPAYFAEERTKILEKIECLRRQIRTQETILVLLAALDTSVALEKKRILKETKNESC